MEDPSKDFFEARALLRVRIHQLVAKDRRHYLGVSDLLELRTLTRRTPLRVHRNHVAVRAARIFALLERGLQLRRHRQVQTFGRAIRSALVTHQAQAFGLATARRAPQLLSFALRVFSHSPPSTRPARPAASPPARNLPPAR